MDDAIPLCDANLTDLPQDVRVPGYDRSVLTPGIVHIGLGNFHRAHQAWYLHRLMEEGIAQDWAILGAGVRPADEERRGVLAEQDYLTTLIELDPSGKSAEVTGSMIGFVPVEDGNAPLIAQMADPAIRIVSLTVTEGGYYQNESGAFDAGHPDIRHDAENPEAPGTAFGALIAALRQRREAGTGPFTCQSCDNLQGNGDVLKQTILGLARLQDDGLANWIEAECTFPNSMVDCIVPATGKSELALVREFGVADAAPVTHENFRQWVIEDRFCAGRPDWDRAGATFTDDVHAFEAMKIRLLNGGHQIIANPGEILGIETIHGVMQHPPIRKAFQKIAHDEIAPHVAAVPDMTPDAYIDLISERFANPEIRDTTRRVAFDGSSRHTGFLLPVIRDALQKDAAVDGLALAEALWARMCEGTREDGTEIAPNDPHWDDLTTAAREAKDRPAAWLEQRRFYGNLGNQPRFAEPFARWLSLIWSDGTDAALKSYIDRR